MRDLTIPKGANGARAMKVSVVTVARNAADTIGDALASVGAQRDVDFEHIVIDGASTDSTPAILEAAANPRLRWISEPDAGVYDAMNKGVLQASGELIGFLNADDFFCRTDALSLLVDAAQSSSAMAVCGGVAVVDRAAGRAVRSYSANTFRPWMLRFGHMPPHPGFYARRVAWDRVGRFRTDLRIGGDFEWMARFFLKEQLQMRALTPTVSAVREGGLSNSGFSSRIVINREAERSLRHLGIRSHPALLWSRYFAKSLPWVLPPLEYPAPMSVRYRPEQRLARMTEA
jgi:glycosyltransferase involved in cell wall biosynthesis